MEFVKRVKERTDGRIDIQVVYDKELGEEKQVIEQVQFGAIDFARVSIAPMSEYVEVLNIIQLPYLYEDGDHMWRVLESDIGDEILLNMESEGFIGFTWFDAGARSFYNSKKPITGIEDLEEMDIRIMESELMQRISTALGFNGIQLPYGQIYSGIQQGALDGAENNYPSYLTAAHYEVAGYFSIDEHLRVPEVVVGSKKALEVLTEEELKIIRDVAKETTVYQKKLWKEMNSQARGELEKKGVNFNLIEDRAPFIKAVEGIYKSYEEDYGDLIERIRNQ